VKQIQTETIPPVYFSCWTTVPLTSKFVPSKIYFQPESFHSAPYKAYNSTYAVIKYVFNSL